MNYNLEKLKSNYTDYILSLCLKHKINDENDIEFMENFLCKNPPKNFKFYKYNIIDKKILNKLKYQEDYIIKKEKKYKKEDILNHITFGTKLNYHNKNNIYLSPKGILKYYKETKLKTSLYSKLFIYCLENS